MLYIKNFAAAAAAAVLCFYLSACSKGSDTSATSSESTSSVSEKPVTSESQVESASSDDSKAETSHIGEYLQGVADIYSKGNYTLECTISGSAFSGDVKLTRVVRGDDFYQLQQEAAGSYGTITLDGASYDFDYLCGMYHTSSAKPTLNVVDEIINADLEQTATHEDPEQDEYAVEEYTYTGDTYITVMDFYFNKDDKSLAKYTTVYSVEGQDDITETRVIDRLDNNIDESVFNTDFKNVLADFDSMSEDQRLGFCQGLCASRGISTDDMYEMNITSDDLKKISYDELFKLVYTYGAKNNG